MHIPISVRATTLVCMLYGGLCAAEEGVVATVNGVQLSQELLDAYAEAMQTQGRNPQGEELLEELVVQEVLIQEANSEGLPEDPAVLRALEIRRRNFLAQSLLERYLATHEPDDEALQQIYDQVVASNSGKQYKARHVLLESEDDAKAVIVELQGGADFAELAKARSTGPSAPQGGDLGWFSPDSMVPPFAQAVQSMEMGSYSEEPVQTQFGWHVILLEEVRDTEPPPFEEVKPQLKEQAQRQQLADYVASLRAKAKVEQ